MEENQEKPNDITDYYRGLIYERSYIRKQTS